LHDPLYHSIRQTGDARWFEDEVVDTGFDFIEHIMECHRHSIVLSGTHMAKNLHDIGANSKPKADGTMKMPEFDRDAMAKFMGNEIIIVPVNDGFTAQPPENDNTETKASRKPDAVAGAGAPWSIMLIDCRYEVLIGHYFDSLNDQPCERNHTQIFAKNILEGLQLMLNNTPMTPHQY
jgi:hypothetical protein